MTDKSFSKSSYLHLTRSRRLPRIARPVWSGTLDVIKHTDHCVRIDGTRDGGAEVESQRFLGRRGRVC